MGLMGKLCSSKPDFPAIGPNSAAAARIATVEKELSELAGKVHDALEVAKVVDDLRGAYERNQDADRYTAHVRDVDVVVTPSPRLEQEVHQIIDKILRHSRQPDRGSGGRPAGCAVLPGRSALKSKGPLAGALVSGAGRRNGVFVRTRGGVQKLARSSSPQ